MALMALVGMTFRIAWMYAQVAPAGISPAVAVALLAASFSLVANRPAARVVQLLTDDSPGAVVVRRLLPAAVALPLLVGWAQALGRRSGWFDVAAGEGMLTAVTIIACVMLVLWTARKLDDLHLHRSRAELRADTQREWLDVTLAGIGDAVITADRSGRVGLVNRATESLIGVKAEGVVGRPIDELVQLVDEHTREPLESPFDDVFTARRMATVGGEPAVRTRDGRLRAVDATAMPIVGADGTLVGAVLVLRDATARRERERAMRAAYADLDRRVGERTEALGRAKAALRESTALLQTFVTSTPEPILAKDVDGRIIMVNPAALRALGLTQEQVLGHSKVELYGDSEETRRIIESDQRVLHTGEPAVVEETLGTPKGPRTFLVTKSPLRDNDGRIIGVVGVAADITERKRIQRELEQLLMAEHRLRAEAERASRAKDEFLAVVSHELRSPLNALKGWSHILSGTTVPAPVLVTRAAQAIRRNVDHQSRLIDDLLDTSRIISGKLVLEHRPVNLVEVVHAALDVSRTSALAKRIELRFTSDYPVVTTDGDHGRLQQVVINLLSNAIKFTQEGGRIDIVLERTGDRIELSVTDTGVGIEPDFLPHVFDRFSQANSSTTRRYQGLGIGLALARHLVEMHQGTIGAASPGPGGGSRFVVDLPATHDALVSEGPGALGEAVQATRLDGVSVLAVDDDPDARDVISLMLSNAGARVRTFESGQRLLAALAEEAQQDGPVVLLLDIAMPDEDGFSVLKRVRALNGASFIPAIAVTALTHLERSQLTMEGFQDCVGKPVDVAVLIEAIALQARRSPAELAVDETHRRCVG
jgi:PAS domain S-box-containing protein